MRAHLFVSACLLAACGGGAAPQPAPAPQAPVSAEPAAPPPSGAAPMSAVGGLRDAPEISRSLGEPSGFVVFWPRVVPAGDAQLQSLAERAQQRLRAAVEQAVPGAPVDVRPAPERVCPRDGCQAMTVGAVVAGGSKPGACVVVAVVSGAGVAPARLVPWVGEVAPKMPEVPFRDPPESQITVKDWADCTGDAAFAAGEEAVVDAIRAVENARVGR